jgi:hypothetical protein
MSFCECISKCLDVGIRTATNLILQVHYRCASWQRLHYYLTSPDYLCLNIQVWFPIVYALVRMKFVMVSGSCHWNWCCCVLCAFCSCDIYSDGCNVCVAVLQDCPELLFWFMIDSAFSFHIFAWRMSPDKKMKSIVRVKISLISFIWAYVRLLSQMWTVMCMQCDTQCLCQG